MGADKCWLSDSGMIMTKSMSILKIHLFHVCMCSCEHLTCGKFQQLERREPNHSIHESMELEVVRILILHVNMEMNVFVKTDCILLWRTEFAMDAWITKDGYSGSSFISAVLIQIKYVIEYGFIMPWMVFHLTTLCKSCYCYCQVHQKWEWGSTGVMTFEIHETSFLGKILVSH